jgi:hypothetical protein
LIADRLLQHVHTVLGHQHCGLGLVHVLEHVLHVLGEGREEKVMTDRTDE